MSRCFALILLLFAALSGGFPLLAAGTKAPPSGWPEVCYNRHLVEAVKIINSACRADCNMDLLSALNSVDKDALFAALSTLELRPVHVFFDTNVDTITKSLHWADWTQRHVDNLQNIERRRSVIFVVGRASPPGDFDLNYGLSQRRAQSVVTYLETTLKLTDVPIRIGWLGEEVLQLTHADAAQLHIDKSQYDGNLLKLNQSVHVFVVPCADKLGF